MNKFKEEADNDVCIRDLKQLGKEGGATAYLDNGQIVKLKAKYGTIRIYCRTSNEIGT